MALTIDAREFGRHAVQRVLVLAEERGRDRAPAGRSAGFVFLAEHQRGVLPEHLVLALVAQLDARGHRDHVARGQLLVREAQSA